MKRYDLSRIMKRAWYIFRHTINATFGECLKDAWKQIKDEVAMDEKIAARRKAEQEKSRAYDYRLHRAYYGCKFGRNDWASDYQNDVRAAVRRAADLNRLSNR